jgi:chromosome partitioning protein
MRTWCMASQKGGSGKSTLAVNLSVYAEDAGETVLVVDLDPQGSASTWFEVREDKAPHVIAADAKNLREIIASAKTVGCTLVIIDTAPHANNEAAEAVSVADLIICPTRASLFDIASLRETIAILHAAEAIDKAVAVINAVGDERPAEIYEEAATAVGGLGLKVAPSFVCHRATFEKAINQGKGVTETRGKSHAAKEIIALWHYLNTLSPLVKIKKKLGAAT